MRRPLRITFLVSIVLLASYIGAYFWTYSNEGWSSQFPIQFERSSKFLRRVFQPLLATDAALERREIRKKWYSRVGKWKSYYPESLNFEFDLVSDDGLFFLRTLKIENQSFQDLGLEVGQDGALVTYESFTFEIIDISGELWVRFNSLGGDFRALDEMDIVLRRPETNH